MACRVEHIAAVMDASSKLDFTSLSESINSLIASSLSLDAQRDSALQRLRKLLPKPKHPKHGFLGRVAQGWWRLRAKCGSMEGSERLRQMDLWTEPSLEDRVADFSEGVELRKPKLPKFPLPRLPPIKRIKEIKEVLAEIRGINKKLQGFESGFISEDGLKGREWYKHKGVAPGLWLGYGATTFPAVTEALTIDHSPKEAQKEVYELAGMIEKMAKRLAE